MYILKAFLLALVVTNTIVPARLSRAHAAYGTAAQADMRELVLGAPIEREIGGGEAHAYRITLASGQYLRVVVDQRGINVSLNIIRDNQSLGEVNSEDSAQESERVSLVTEKAGEYRLEVRSVEKNAVAGHYKIEIAELRAATTQDSNRILAERAYAEGQLLRWQQTAESKRKAIEKLEVALPLWQAVADRREEAVILSSIGEVYRDMGDNPKALEYYNRALPLLKGFDSSKEETALLVNIGEAYRELGEYRKALDYQHQALPRIRASGNHQREAVVLNNIGLAHRSLGETDKALDYYGQALQIRRSGGDRLGEARTLANIGSVYWSVGELPKALEYYNQALPIIRATGNRQLEANTISNVGSTYSSMGENQKALEYYHQALDLRRAVGDRRGEAMTLSNMGLAYYVLGEKQKALEYYTLSLPLRRVTGDRQGEGTTLNNIGSLYRSVGEYEKALEFFDQALALRRAVGDRQGESQTLNNIGVAYRFMGEPRKALEYYQQALPLQQAVGDRLGEAASLSNIGLFYASTGEHQKAMEYYQRSLPISRTAGDRLGEADSLADIGSVYAARGDGQNALEHFIKSLAISRAIGDRRSEAITLSDMARVKRDQDQLAEARADMEGALEIIESLRTKVASQYRASYFALNQNYYEFYTDLLMRLDKRQASAGHAAAALFAAERARARSLLETLAEARTDIRQGAEPALLERERTLQQQLNAKADRLTRMLSGKHAETQAEAARKELASVLADYQDVQAQLRARSPRYAALTQPQPLTLKEIQQMVLDSDTLLLEYALGAERSYLWAVTQSSMTSYELSGRDDIERAARRFYELLTSSNRIGTEVQTKLTAAELSGMLLGPVAGQLGNKRLLIVADGALQYVPFAALPAPLGLSAGSREPGNRDSNQAPTSIPHPLIADHEIVSVPSASALAVLRREVTGRQPASKLVAVLADPVLESNDPRVRQVSAKDQPPGSTTASTGLGRAKEELVRSAKESGVGTFERLRFSRAEADAIEALATEKGSLKAVDFEANRMTATSADLAHYRIVHFATHGLINSQHPELSGLVLSLVDEQGKQQDGFLRLHDIYNLKLGADMVVLSACRTALGKDVKGEGLLGLTRGFMYAGAQRVVASLWDVRDEATAALMKRFYQGMLREKLRPAAALRAAQISMSKDSRWKDPYYWAGFVLQGEWK
jgi:CHAT domain-containing protein/Tfp pilus assembly protein PilF